MGRRQSLDEEIMAYRRERAQILRKRKRVQPGIILGVPIDETYTDEQREFLMAMDTLKKEVGPHPTWAQVLRKAREMGYRKIDHQE